MSKPLSYNFSELPTLKEMVWPALKTVSRGVKIPESGLHINGVYPNVYINPNKLLAYKNYFGFRGDMPITYLYLLTQRAQAALMLKPTYSISIPGTLHLDTQIAIYKEIDPLKGFGIETDIQVGYKKEGSLAPVFNVSFLQEDDVVAKASGTYLVKRKSQSKNKGAKPKIEILNNAPIELEWQLNKDTAADYANISDDHNPIHKSLIAAKIAGFKSQIMHGWYVASRCAQHLEQQNRRAIKGFEIAFYGTHNLPGNYIYKSKANQFQTLDHKQEKVLSAGSVLYI